MNVVLPSESAQYLANYLREKEDEFLKHCPGNSERVVYTPELAKLIQEYWDALP